MILPTKRLGVDRALLNLGGDILRVIDEPKTVSRTWEEFKRINKGQVRRRSVTYDWFVLALDLLYAIGAISLLEGRLERSPR